jgi:hypothetical protein
MVPADNPARVPRNSRPWHAPALGSFFHHQTFIPMNYQAFTNASLTMMCEGICGAWASDEALATQSMEIRFRIRETPDRRLPKMIPERTSHPNCRSSRKVADQTLELLR